MCESCPTDKIHWDAITKMCTPCATSCPTGQIQDGETCVCYCDTSKYELEPNQNGECVCKTEDVVEMDIASTGINSSVWECRITTNNLGKLKGTYYFEWVDGYHYYNCKTKRVGFATYVFEGTKNLGYIINKDSDFVGNGEGYNVGTTKQVTNALRNQPIKYFTFNGLADITIQFWDNECDNNCGSMNFKLHKVVDYCLTE